MARAKDLRKLACPEKQRLPAATQVCRLFFAAGQGASPRAVARPIVMPKDCSGRIQSRAGVCNGHLVSTVGCANRYTYVDISCRAIAVPRMRIVTYNIQYGKGKDGRFDLPRIAREVEGADLIALQEVERFWQRSGMVDQPAELARLLDGYHWVYGPGIDLAGDGTARRQFGNMLLSRTPILSTRNHLLPKYASLGPMSLQRAALEGVIETEGRALRAYSVHLTHLSAQTRLPQVERLLQIHRDAEREGAAVMGDLKAEWTLDGVPGPMPATAIVMGDFNAEPDSREYECMVGPKSPYGGRMTNPTGFVDAWAGTGLAESSGVTADIDGRPVRLDYCFVSASLAPNLRSCSIDNEATGSDHQPVWVELEGMSG